MRGYALVCVSHLSAPKTFMYDCALARPFKLEAALFWYMDVAGGVSPSTCTLCFSLTLPPPFHYCETLIDLKLQTTQGKQPPPPFRNPLQWPCHLQTVCAGPPQLHLPDLPMYAYVPPPWRTLSSASVNYLAWPNAYHCSSLATVAVAFSCLSSHKFNLASLLFLAYASPMS